jgi:hypothetical protein
MPNLLKNIAFGLLLLGVSSCASHDKGLTPEELNAAIEPFDKYDKPTQCSGRECIVFTKGNPYVWGTKIGINPEEWMEVEPYRLVYYGQGARLQVDEYHSDKYEVEARFTNKN